VAEEKKRVAIYMRSVVNGEPVPEHRYEGIWYDRRGTLYVTYQETLDEPEKKSAVVRTLLKVRGQEITLTRTGGVRSEMHWAVGKRTAGQYRNKYAALTVGIVTKRVQVTADAIAWEYVLLDQGAVAGEFAMRLRCVEL
jgi:uncharacterized beta-barrel protein YwiB (DUF1934 family)